MNDTRMRASWTLTKATISSWLERMISHTGTNWKQKIESKHPVFINLANFDLL